jgi:hypothetical protein
LNRNSHRSRYSLAHRTGRSASANPIGIFPSPDGSSALGSRTYFSRSMAIESDSCDIRARTAAVLVCPPHYYTAGEDNRRLLRL